MLFAPNGLVSGPQARFSAEEEGTKVKGGKPYRLRIAEFRLRIEDHKTRANSEGGRNNSAKWRLPVVCPLREPATVCLVRPGHFFLTCNSFLRIFNLA
jgi:hypothetical protein